ncbi:MAG: hypothetical protein JW765_06000 [Deltaproteobacteria bacterium]|nr:hypothetical protein [Candidatus Zymogenaceae bacterium]
MKVTTFNCKHCGASVTVPDAPGTVICTYCGSSHRVSFHDGSVTAQLIAKVKKLDEDVALLKGAGALPKKKPGTKERLEMIDEGRRKWHQYVSLANAGKGKRSPEMMGVYKMAQTDLLVGYGPENGVLVNLYYNPERLSDDPAGGYSCLFIQVGIIIILLVLGGLALSDAQIRNAVILLTLGVSGIVAGIPFIIYNIRAEKAEMAKREEALRRLGEVEREMRRRLVAEGNT